MRRLLSVLVIAATIATAAGCGDRGEKDKYKDLDRPKSAEKP